MDRQTLEKVIAEKTAKSLAIREQESKLGKERRVLEREVAQHQKELLAILSAAVTSGKSK